MKWMVNRINLLLDYHIMENSLNLLDVLGFVQPETAKNLKLYIHQL